MRTVSGSDAASIDDIVSSSWVQVEIEDSAGVLRDHSASVVRVEYDAATDEIVDGCTVEILRGDNGTSLAPLMGASPDIAVGRDIVVSVDPGGGTFREVFRGRVDVVDWPNRFGRVLLECRDQAGLAADTIIETQNSYGSSGGTALETVAQSIATDHLTSAPTIYVPSATAAVVVNPPEYAPVYESVLQTLRTLVDSIGWVLRWRWIDSLTTWRWTLYEPSRAKAVADHTFGTSDYYDVSTMRQSIEDVRNVVIVEYSDSSNVRQTVTVTDAASITAYGRRAMRIQLASDDPIRDSTRATALANAALSDLAEPDAIVEITAPYFWPGELGVDLYEFTANSVHFSSNQTLAPVAFRHRLVVGERAESKILCRGQPTSGQMTWRRKAKTGAGAVPSGSVVSEKVAPDAVDAEKLAAINMESGKHMRSTTYTAGSAGWSIEADGSAEFNNVTLRGALDGVTGTFAGTLEAVSGTFSSVFAGLLNNLETNPTRGIRLDSGSAIPGTWTDYIDIAATGTNPVVQVGGLSILADGTTLVEDEVAKTRRISHHGFRPFSDAISYTSALNNTTSTAALADFACPLPIPVGATITAIRFRGAEGDIANDCDATLYRQEDGGTNTAIQTVSIGTTGTETRTELVSPNEVVSETYTYIVHVEMNYVSGTGPSFRWFEVDYTTPDYRTTL